MSDLEDPLQLPSDEVTVKSEENNDYIDVNKFLTIKQEDEDDGNEDNTEKQDVSGESQSQTDIGQEDLDDDDNHVDRNKRPKRQKTATKSKDQDKPLKKNGMYLCDKCKFMSKYPHAVKIHRATHSEEKPFECTLCDYKTKFATSLKRHTTHQHEEREKNLTCNQCEYRTAFKSNLRLHMKKHFKEQCVKCLRKFDRDVMPAHMDWCGMNIFVPNGNALVPNGNALNGNASVEAEEGIFVPTCELVEGEGEVACAGDNDGGESHLIPIRSVDDFGTVSYGCNKCEYKSAHKHACKGHMRKHYDERPFECSLESCDYTTKYVATLNRHRLMHVAKKEIVDQSIKYYECELCEYKTVYKNNLKVHERKHSADKKYQCNVCDFKTAHPTSYAKHKRMHERESTVSVNGKYMCDKCCFKTSHEGRLDFHMLKSHQEIQDGSHQCPFCSFATKEKWRISVHKGRSRVADVLKCLHCEFETFYKCEFRGHKKAHILEYSGKTSKSALPQKEKEMYVSNPNANDPNIIDQMDFKWSKILVIENRALEKPFMCYQCGYASRHKCGVQKHYRRHHLDYLPFDCEKCPFVTKTKDALQLHLKRSRIDAVLVCSCGFETFHKCELACHQKIHNPYRCDKCTYSYKNRYDLERHNMKMHEGNSVDDCAKVDSTV